MKVSNILKEEDAVSSTLGVVLMIAVTVVLAAAVGSFALGIAADSTKETPSVTMETKWGADGSGTTYVDITHESGSDLKTAFLSVKIGGSTVWDSGSTTGVVATYSDWDGEGVQASDRLRLKNDGAMTDGDTLQVVWNNGQKSQVLTTGTVQ